MRTHLDLLMEFLQKSDEDQRSGWIMRKKLKWHGLQMKKEHRLNVEEEETLLRAVDYERKGYVLIFKKKKSNQEMTWD